MDRTLPDDWEDQVVRAYAAFGIEPGTEEFGLHFPRLSTSFLRTKAIQQLRDKFGRWREERGKLDLPGQGQSRRAGLEVTSRSRGPVEKLAPDAIVPALTAAGFKEDRANDWKGRGTVYRIPGSRNFIFVAEPEQALGEHLKEEYKDYNSARKSLEYEEMVLLRALDRKAADPTAKIPTDEALAWQEQEVVAARARFEQAEELWQEQSAAWRKAYDFTPETTTAAYADKVAEDASRLFSQAIAKMPRWRKGDGKGFMLSFDEGAMPVVPEGNRIYPGMAPLGGQEMYVARGRFYGPIDHAMESGWSVQTDAQMAGEYVIAHEAGHMVDAQPGSTNRSSTNRSDVYRAAVEAGEMSQYGREGGPMEGYAEAYAQWQSDPQAPLAKRYDEAFGWSQDKPNNGTITAEELASLFGEDDEEVGHYTPPPEDVPVQRLRGQQLSDAMKAAGFPPEKADVYAKQGDGFTRDGKVWSFAAYTQVGDLAPQKAAIEAAIVRLQGISKRFEESGVAPMAKMIAPRIAAMERRLVEIDRLREGFLNGSIPGDQLLPGDAEVAEMALAEMEAAVAKMPEWRQAGRGPFMAEADWGINARTSPGVAGVAKRGTDTLAVNPLYYDPILAATITQMRANLPEGIEPPQTLGTTGDTVFHESGHLVDTTGDDGSSSTDGMAIWQTGRKLMGATPYAQSKASESYADAYSLWARGYTSLPFVQYYAELYGWEDPQRRNPTAEDAEDLVVELRREAALMGARR